MDKIPALVRTLLFFEDLRHAVLTYRCQCDERHSNLCRNGGESIAFCHGSRECPIPACDGKYKTAWELRKHFPACFLRNYGHEIDLENGDKWYEENDLAWLAHWHPILVSRAPTRLPLEIYQGSLMD